MFLKKMIADRIPQKAVSTRTREGCSIASLDDFYMWLCRHEIGISGGDCVIQSSRS